MLLQFIANGIISGALIAIMGLGFWFIYRTTYLFHIAHGAVYTASFYIFYTLYVSGTNPLILAIVVSLLFGALLGTSMYFTVYRPLEKRDASAGIKFISSLAIYIYILIVNIIALTYGNETKMLSEGLSESISFSDIILTKMQIYQVISFLVILVFSYFFVNGTRADIDHKNQHYTRMGSIVAKYST